MLVTAAAAQAASFRYLQALRAARPSATGIQRKDVRKVHGAAARSFPIRSFCLRVSNLGLLGSPEYIVNTYKGAAATRFAAEVFKLVDLRQHTSHAVPLGRLCDPAVYAEVRLSKAPGAAVLCHVELDPQQQGSLLGKHLLRMAVAGSGMGRMGEATLRLLPAVADSIGCDGVIVAVSVQPRHRQHAAIDALERQAHAEASFTLPTMTDMDVAERLTALGGVLTEDAVAQAEARLVASLPQMGCNGMQGLTASAMRRCVLQAILQAGGGDPPATSSQQDDAAAVGGGVGFGLLSGSDDSSSDSGQSVSSETSFPPASAAKSPSSVSLPAEPPAGGAAVQVPHCLVVEALLQRVYCPPLARACRSTRRRRSSEALAATKERATRARGGAGHVATHPAGKPRSRLSHLQTPKSRSGDVLLTTLAPVKARRALSARRRPPPPLRRLLDTRSQSPVAVDPSAN